MFPIILNSSSLFPRNLGLESRAVRLPSRAASESELRTVHSEEIVETMKRMRDVPEDQVEVLKKESSK